MKRLTTLSATLFILAALVLSAATPASAATIVIVNNDGAGEGFNDPTVVAPVGGNPGTTIGQQRLNVFQEAADIWGALLPSAATIRVRSQFNALSCDAGGAVLGSAGPTEVFRDFTGAEIPATWYHVALASKLAGVDLSPSNEDLSATFNSDIDNNNNCLSGTNWYYGLDGNEGNDVELLPVVLHELGHGLGFSTLVSSTTGSEFMGFPDVYESFLFDNITGLHWDDMSSGQRATSAVNTGNVVWDGPVSTAKSPNFLGGTPTLFVNSGGSLPATIPIGTAQFGAALTSTGVTGNIVLVDDGVGTVTDACDPPLVNAAAISGNIALIDRGTCAFTAKASAAQAAGAIAVIIANNVGDPDPIGLGGSDPSITIPVVSVTLADGNAIKAELPGVNITLGLDAANLAGADGSNRVKVYTPNPVEGGSSVSHWDVSAFPNLLMEPAINGNLSNDVDLTLAHFTDIGWLQECLTPICLPSITEDKNTNLQIEFCVVNCGDAPDSIHVTVSDDMGWCTPIDQVFLVAAGDTLCVTLDCTTPDVCDTLVSTITLDATSCNGGVAACTTQLTSEPATGCTPVLEVSPASIIFSGVALGDTACDVVTVSNTGDADLNVSSVTGCDTGQFFLDLTGFNSVIAPGDSSQFLVCVSPTGGGSDSCTVTGDPDGGNFAVSVQLGSTTGIGDGPGAGFLVSGLFPTPFRAAAEIRFNLPQSDRVQVEVFDFQGRQVRVLAANSELPAGEQRITWDGRDGRGAEVAGGIYFLRVATASYGAKVVRAVRLD